jgi:hypothetical protein
LIQAHLEGQGQLPAVPPPVLATLLAARRRNQAAFAQQAYVLARLAALFDAHHIPFRLLKGLAVAQQAYPAPEARPVGDIDLWIRPADVRRVEALLQEAGLQKTPDYYGRPATFLRTYAAEQEFLPGDRRGLPGNVDLHWHLVAPWWLRAALRVPEAAIFARAVPVCIAGTTYPTLAPTDAFYYLCLHAAINHRFVGRRWLLDLQWLARSGQVDWPQLTTLAATSGTPVILWRALDLLDTRFGTTHRVHRVWCPARWHRHLARMLLPAPPLATARSADRPAEPRIPLLVLLPGPGAMARAVLRLLWPPPRWIRLRYPRRPGGPLFQARLAHLLRVVWTRSTN